MRDPTHVQGVLSGSTERELLSCLYLSQLYLRSVANLSFPFPFQKRPVDPPREHPRP